MLSTSVSPPLDKWRSLVQRSIQAWERISWDRPRADRLMKEILQDCRSLDDFLIKGTNPMFWFFQRREAFLLQEKTTQWSQDCLDDYVLLPACPGFVTRSECFFVSHFWRTREHPDPDSKYLCLYQEELQHQDWSYVWVDWSCMPQSPRSELEQT